MNPAPATEFLNLVCPNCATKNRLPARRASEDPHCGKCSAILLPGERPQADDIRRPPPEGVSHLGSGPSLTQEPLVLSDLNFERVVAGTELPVIVDFHAIWCGPCRTMAPQFARAAADAKGRALFVKVDSDASPATAARFAIRSIPTVLRLNRGTEVERFSGVRSAAELVRFALA